MLKIFFLSLLAASAAVVASAEPTTMDPHPIKRYRTNHQSKIIEHFDKDGDGRLNETEYAEYRRHLDRRLEVRFDKNKDGKLDEDERKKFERFIKLRDLRRKKMSERNKQEHAELWKKLREAKKKAAQKAPARPIATPPAQDTASPEK